MLIFSYTSRRMSFGNEIHLSKYPGSCSFRIYMFMGFYLQNTRSDCLLFPTPSGGRLPLLIKCTYPSTLDHVVSEYLFMRFYIQNLRNSCFFSPAPSGGRCPLEIKYTYPNTLDHIVSKYCIGSPKL